MGAGVAEVAERYGVVADGFGAVLAGVGRDQWSAASPCEGWTARDVAVHVIDTHRRVRSVLGDVAYEEAGSDQDLRTAWASATDAVRRALADADLASTTVAGMFGEQTFESLVSRLLCADTLIHTWDLARATGQGDKLDPDAVEKSLEFLTPIDDAIRRPGGFGPKLEPPPGADAQGRLLAFAGRTA